MGAQYEVRGTVAVITLNNPPVNGLGYETRRDFCAGVERALADNAVGALVVTGAGKAFSGGADIKEFGSPKSGAEPNLLTMIRMLDDATKPVVAAIHSVCMGGGLELALGCHYRLAAPGTQVALPEVKIGLIPGAGGTQRLPRVLGVETALNMIVSGEAVKSETLAALPGQKLFDRIVSGDLLTEAVAFAQEVAAKHAQGATALPRVRDMKVTHPNPDAYFGFARNTVKAMSKNFPAPLKCVDAVEAALKRKFDDGRAYELELFMGLIPTPESKALRHAFFGERAASKIPDVPESTAQRQIQKVAVIGAGTMGGGISMNFLNAGIPVTMLEMKQEALDRGVATIRKNYDSQVKKGKLKQDKLDQRMALLSTTLNYADIADADLVIEAVFEEMGVKEKVFKTLDEVMKPGAILASNTSTLDVDAIAAFTKRPQDVVGMHFFSPANVMKLLEVVRGKHTAKDVLATVMALGKKIRKTSVVSGVCDGFIGNRMIEQYRGRPVSCWKKARHPSRSTARSRSSVLPWGPSAWATWPATTSVGRSASGAMPRSPTCATARPPICCARWAAMARRRGAGWYDYQPGKRDAIPSPVVNQMIEKHRADLGVKPRKISEDEIVHRLVYSLVNEGAKILEEGIASKASDIDMVYLTGYGFPLHRGGPMCYADQQGLFNVVQTMKKFAANPLDDAAFWQPAPLLARLAEEGKSFT
jgi:3-hydroxyacyl-CoA dehydrogenase